MKFGKLDNNKKIQVSDENEDLLRIYLIAKQHLLSSKLKILNHNGISLNARYPFSFFDSFLDLMDVDPKIQRAKSFKLTNYGIGSVPENIFNQYPSLVAIDLSGNEINILPDDLFMEKQRLKYLNLANNNIIQIPWFQLGQLQSLEILDLRNNPVTVNWKRKCYAFKRLHLPQRLHIKF